MKQNLNKFKQSKANCSNYGIKQVIQQNIDRIRLQGNQNGILKHKKQNVMKSSLSVCHLRGMNLEE